MNDFDETVTPENSTDYAGYVYDGEVIPFSRMTPLERRLLDDNRRQQAKIERLQDELKALRDELIGAAYEDDNRRQQAEIERLQDELKALRDELIGAAYESEANPSFDPLPTLDALADHIRQIL